MSLEDDWRALTLAEQEAGSHYQVFPPRLEPTRVFVYPDIHFPFQDKQFLEYLDAKCDELNPHHIVIIGDLLDMYSMSSFDKDPKRRETLNDERNVARKWLRSLRARHPQARIDVIEGNHEERLRRVLKKQPGLYDLPELEVANLLSLGEMNITYHPRHGFLAHGLRFKHGDLTPKYAANAELMKHWAEGVSGHTHREDRARYKTAEGHQYYWYSVGHACDMDMVEYVRNPNWNHHTIGLAIQPNGDREVKNYRG